MSQLKNQPVDPKPRQISSRSIFGEDKLVLIEHEHTVYRLMITRQDKLILTK